MTTNSKMAAAGLAILLAGTAIGWGASRMPSRRPAWNEPQTTAFTSLPLASIDTMALGTKLRDIGRFDGSTAPHPKAG